MSSADDLIPVEEFKAWLLDMQEREYQPLMIKRDGRSCPLGTFCLDTGRISPERDFAVGPTGIAYSAGLATPFGNETWQRKFVFMVDKYDNYDEMLLSTYGRKTTIGPERCLSILEECLSQEDDDA